MTLSESEFIVTGATVLTMDSKGTEAEAFAISNGSVIGVGSVRSLNDALGPLPVTDVGGAVIVPGMIDAHGHLEVFAISSELAVDHRTPPVDRISDIVERLAARAQSTPKGEWIIGQGSHFQDTMLDERRYPDRFELDEASTDHPIVARFSFHINVLNSCAIDRLGLSENTPDPPGGRFERDVSGRLTGRTFDVYSHLGVPDWPATEVRAGMKSVVSRYLAAGVTTIADIPIQAQGVPALLDLARTNDLGMRVIAYPTIPGVISLDSALDGSLTKAFAAQESPRLKLGGVKLFVDGGLTSAAAALHEPYAHTPGYRGEMAFEADELAAMLLKLDAAGHQIMIHAIGDRAFDVTLEAMAPLPPRNGRPPHRIEHGGNAFLTPARMKRLRECGVLPVPNPPFIYTIAGGYREYLGEERSRPLFPFRTLLEAGFPLPGNSDSVGVDPRMHNPMFGIWCLTSRVTKQGEIVDPEEAISVAQALLMYTRHAAESLGVDRKYGSIEVGKVADFAVLEKDPRTASPDELLDLRVLSTWLDGRAAYTAPAS